MKIAIESNDGKTIKLPFEDTKGYIICDVNKDNRWNTTYSKVNKRTSSSNKNPLNQCTTIVTRGMDKKRIEHLKNNGIDIFVTFNTSVESALISYLKEQIINQPVYH